MRNLRPFRFPGRWRTFSPTQTRIQSPLHHKVNGSCQSQGRYRFRFRDRSPAVRDNPSRREGALLFRFPFPGPGKGSVRTSLMGLVFRFLLFCPVSGISGPSFPKCPAGNPLFTLLRYKRKRRLHSLPRPGYRTRPRVRFRYPRPHCGSPPRRGRSRRCSPRPR